MGSLNPKAYSAILRTREAYRFDAGAFLMRLFAYTTTIGTITMLTLAGASAFEASSVASLIAVCMFVVTPRVSKRIDEKGQSAVVPAATGIAAAGLALMFATTHLGLPFWLNYLAAPLVSFLPNVQALVRTRWTFLIGTGRLGRNAPPLKTAYAYEGILEDIAFMVGPAAVVALSATIDPIAGMLAGAVLYCIGAALLVSSKDTEPQPGWKPFGSQANQQQSPLPDASETVASQSNKSILRSSPVMRVLFASMILFGAVYGALDTAAISYCESIDFATLASIMFVSESVFSVVMSFAFGILGLSSPMRRQFVAASVLFGCLYALFPLVNSPISLLVIACVSALSYAPMYITTTLTCELAVPSEHLTEAISWISSGQSIGMVIGPISAGAVIDAWGPLAGFNLITCYALALVAITLACIPVLCKHL